MLFLVAAVTLLIVLFFKSWKNLIRDRKSLNLPGPVLMPVIGNSYMFLGDAAGFFQVIEKISATYKDAAIFYIFSRRYIYLQCPKYIEAIVSNVGYNTKGVSYNFLRPWLGQGLLTSSGYRWKSHRKFLTPAFHFNILQNFLPVFCKNTRVLVGKLKDRADGKTTIDVFPLVAMAALDNVTESIMGVCVNAQNDTESRYVKAIEDLSNLVSTRMRNPFLGDELIFSMMPHKSRQEKALEILHGQTRKVIEARRRELENSNITSLQQSSDLGIKNKHAFLDLLLLSEIDGQRIDDEKIREEVDTFMFEGHDTTTSGIAFALYCLSKNKGTQEQILKEQKDVLGDEDRDPSYNELKQMKYLEAVIKESLRLYPSVPLIERLTTQDSVDCDLYGRQPGTALLSYAQTERKTRQCVATRDALVREVIIFFCASPRCDPSQYAHREVAGLHLPRDTSIVIDIFHMQRRGDIYESPLQFRPERFLGQDAKNPFNWIAFSAGPRNCIGQKFAMMEMKVTLAAIVKEFHIAPCEQEPKLVADLILRSQNGVNITFIPRK